MKEKLQKEKKTHVYPGGGGARSDRVEPATFEERERKGARSFLIGLKGKLGLGEKSLVDKGPQRK